MTARPPRYLDDLPLDAPFECGSFTLSEQEIMDFAEQYDPQPFHLDRAAAEASVFGGLVASSVQSLALSCGLTVRAIAGVQVMGGNAWEDIRLLRPVRPDRPYAVRARWTSVRPSESKPDRGIAKIAIEVRDGDELAMTYGIVYFVRRRPAA
ncbi:MAG TPA: MaoC/PaaZ C-terminal domain-containing protein [Alphaproteobacteria bacterium]|nr:MaoC/PaaZ C-terminal domain-containing protein [Alphaproteobacteria bacterium]